MGIAESIVSSTLGQKGSKAYIPYALFTIGVGGLVYGSSPVRSFADNLVAVSIAFVVGFVGIVASDIGLSNEVSRVLDFDELAKTWKERLNTVHDILGKNRNFLDDIRSMEEKGKVVRRFIPIVTLRLGAFYLTGLSLLFAANQLLAIESQNFLQSIAPIGIGFFILFTALACAVSVLINLVEISTPEQSGGGLSDLSKQMLSSYFLDNVRETSPNSGVIFRALAPLFAIQMLVKRQPMHTSAGLYQFERVLDILKTEVKETRLQPTSAEDFERLKTIKEDGFYEIAGGTRPRQMPLREFSKVGGEELLEMMFSGIGVKDAINCRFRPQTKKGLIVITALKGCFSKFREIRFEGGKTIIYEVSDPKTIFYMFGIGDKSSINDLELQFALQAKRLSGTEMSPCRER